MVIMIGQLYASAKHGWRARIVGRQEDKGKWILHLYDAVDDESQIEFKVIDSDKSNIISDKNFRKSIEEGSAILVEESPYAPTPVINRLDGVE